MVSKRMRVLIAYPGKLLSPWEFLKDVAEVNCMNQSALTLTMLEEFKPHVIAWMFPKVMSHHGLTAELMDACGNLSFIQVIAVGYDRVDVDAASTRGILVSNCGGVGISSESVAELAWAHILSLARRIPQVDAAIKSGEKLTSENWGLMKSTIEVGLFCRVRL